MINLWGPKLATVRQAYIDTWYYRSISVGAIKEPRFGTQPYQSFSSFYQQSFQEKHVCTVSSMHEECTLFPQMSQFMCQKRHVYRIVIIFTSGSGLSFSVWNFLISLNRFLWVLSLPSTVCIPGEF